MISQFYFYNAPVISAYKKKSARIFLSREDVLGVEGHRILITEPNERLPENETYKKKTYWCIMSKNYRHVES